jgi:hypothetical protein
MARDVLSPPPDTDHVVVHTFTTQDEADCAQGAPCPQVLPQRCKTTAPAAGALTCAGLDPGFACSYMSKTWRQHATCLTGPTQRAPSPDKLAFGHAVLDGFSCQLFDTNLFRIVNDDLRQAIIRSDLSGDANLLVLVIFLGSFKLASDCCPKSQR